jgi:hypothetical protein
LTWLALIIANLKQRGNARPGSLKTLKTSIATLFPKSLKPVELDALIQQLQTSGKVRLREDKIIYSL